MIDVNELKFAHAGIARMYHTMIDALRNGNYIQAITIAQEMKDFYSGLEVRLAADLSEINSRKKFEEKQINLFE